MSLTTTLNPNEWSIFCSSTSMQFGCSGQKSVNNIIIVVKFFNEVNSPNKHVLKPLPNKLSNSAFAWTIVENFTRQNVWVLDFYHFFAMSEVVCLLRWLLCSKQHEKPVRTGRQDQPGHKCNVLVLSNRERGSWRVKRELGFALFWTEKLYCTGTGIRVEDFTFGNRDLGQS